MPASPSTAWLEVVCRARLFAHVHKHFTYLLMYEPHESLPLHSLKVDYWKTHESVSYVFTLLLRVSCLDVITEGWEDRVGALAY